MNKTLFRWGNFKSAAGLDLDWKIECDALTGEDWACIAAVGASRVPPFGRVIGVPRGGLPLTIAFLPYVTLGMDRTLVVDDVWTTGRSMREFVFQYESIRVWHGFVAFARGELDYGVTAFAKIGG